MESLYSFTATEKKQLAVSTIATTTSSRNPSHLVTYTQAKYALVLTSTRSMNWSRKRSGGAARGGRGWPEDEKKGCILERAKTAGFDERKRKATPNPHPNGWLARPPRYVFLFLQPTQ